MFNDDSIVIKSPGHPVSPITLKQIRDFEAPSLSRNPRIVYVFDQLRLMEQRGLGFQTIRELLNSELPLPLVFYNAPYLEFTFPRSSEAVKNIVGTNEIQKLNKEELKGLDYLKLHRQLTRKEYQDEFGYDKKKAERHLSHMVELGLVERKGAGPSTYYEITT